MTVPKGDNQRFVLSYKEDQHPHRQGHIKRNGQAGQYRNRKVFHLVGNHEMQFHMKATWTYLEVSHGKRPVTGLGVPANVN